MQKQQQHTERWGDLLDDDGGDFDLAVLLPPPVVVGPDANGMKKVIEYHIDEEGNKVKVTTTTRVRKVRRSRRAIERRSWPKFGDAAKEAAGSRLTMVSTEEIFFDRTRASGHYCSMIPLKLNCSMVPLKLNCSMIPLKLKSALVSVHLAFRIYALLEFWLFICSVLLLLYICMLTFSENSIG